jgi:hypothetical protein
MRTALSLAALFLVAACGSSDPGSGRSGDVEIRLVDAPTTAVSEIVVTITRVDAHVNGKWETLSSSTNTVDLLKLQGGTFALLGVTTIPAGKITQFRLYVTDAGPNYVTTPDQAHHDLTVPSGDESGIKLKANFDVAPCSQGSVTLDFDGKRSIFTHPLGAGAGDEWILRPVIRLKAVSLSGSCNDSGIPQTDGGGSTDGGGGGSDGGGPADSGTSTDGGTSQDGSSSTDAGSGPLPN